MITATIKITDKVFCPSCLKVGKLVQKTSDRIVVRCNEHGEQYITVPKGMIVA